MEQAGPRVPGYELVAPLGTGGSATVWRARREADGLLLALKVVRVGRGGVTGAMREAAVLSRVRHQHLVHLYDVLPLPGDDGRPAAVALAVQLAEGGSLAQVLARRHHLSPGELVTVLGPLAGAVADLHRAGVVHGDLSTGNVLFTADGMPLLSDLGVCRVAGDTSGPLDATDGMVAPEVLEGYPPSADADVYGLGALAWTCLAGEPPGWVGGRPRLEEVVPGLPERLRDLVTSCLEPEPGDRPHAEEVAVALFDVATPEPVEVAPDADPATGLTRRIRERARVERDGTEAEPGADSGGSRRPGGLRLLHPRRRGRGPAEPRPSGSRSRRRLLVALGAVAATAGVVAAAAAWSEAADDPSTTRPAPSAAPGRPPADPSLVTSSPTTAPTEVADPAVPPGEDAVQQLLDARAAAWTDGDVDSLSRAHAAGSPALSQDAGDLASAVAGGYHYAQLDYRLEDLHLVEEPDDSASGPSYEITVTRSAFTVVGPDGVQEPYPEQSEQVRLELRQDGGAWRIWSWGPPAGTTAAAESDL